MSEIDAKRPAVAAERTLVCNAEGVFIWPGVALVERRGDGFVRKPDQEVINLAAALHGPSVIGSALIPALDRAARLLERGQDMQAEGCIAQLAMPPLSSAGEALMRDSPRGFVACIGKAFDPDKHPRWPAGAPDSTGGQFRPGDGANEAPFSGQVAQEFPPLFARPPIVPEEIPRFKEPIPRLSGKEGAKDIPSWARGLRPMSARAVATSPNALWTKNTGLENGMKTSQNIRRFRSLATETSAIRNQLSVPMTTRHERSLR